MYSNTDQLKIIATDQFADGLAKAIANQMDADAADQVQRLPSTLSRGNSVVPYSLATFFLADRFYSKLDVGSFSGDLLVSWNGIDSFVFVPNIDRPFSYTTSQGRVIAPRTMYTDGGSIPRILRGLKKFSSWGYAPAFIIHDWLFTAKKCGHMPDTDWTFSQTAQIMAEAMKTLMEVGYNGFGGSHFKLEKAEDTLYLMYQAVNSFIAEDIWEDDHSTDCVA